VKALRWLQAPTSILQNSEIATNYHGMLSVLSYRAQLMDIDSYEVIVCPTTDTINIAGDADLVDTILKEAMAMGFKPTIINQSGSLGAQQKEEFKEMLIRGGSYSG